MSSDQHRPFDEFSQLEKEIERELRPQSFSDFTGQQKLIENYGKFVLVGHSIGSTISSWYALRYTQHLKTLVSMSPVSVQAPPMTIEEEKARMGTFLARYGLT